MSEGKTYFGRHSEKICPTCEGKEFKMTNSFAFRVFLTKQPSSYSHTMVFECKECKTEVRQSGGTNQYPSMYIKD